MNYLSNKNGFLGIDNKFNFKEKVVIVPFGLEKTVSYGGGTKNGPKEIIKASHQVELYDEELNCEPYKEIGIKTLKPFKIDKNINKALDKMASINNEILNKKLFPMTFGGEHSITPGCLKPFVKKNSSRINIFWAKDKAKWNLNKFKKMIKNKTVYLTFDVDGLDSSIMPATGTPEPGGLLWDETLKIIRIASKNSNIIGADINELAPIKNFNSYNFLVAKLAYKILSYKFLSKKLA